MASSDTYKKIQILISDLSTTQQESEGWIPSDWNLQDQDWEKFFLFITQQKGQFSPQEPAIETKFWAVVEETEKQFLLRSLRRFDVDLTKPRDAQRRRLVVEPVEPAQEEEEVEEVVVAEEEEDELVDPFSFWWSSSDARKLFGARETDQDSSVTLRRKIETLKLINHHKKDGYKLIIDGGDASNECTAADIARLKEPSRILLLA